MLGATLGSARAGGGGRGRAGRRHRRAARGADQQRAGRRHGWQRDRRRRAGRRSPRPCARCRSSSSKDYELPGFVGPDTLVLAVSASGDTEETLGVATEAVHAGARLVAVSQGGALAELARAAGAPWIPVPTAIVMPRAGIGALAVPLAARARGARPVPGRPRRGRPTAVTQLQRRRDAAGPAGQRGRGPGPADRPHDAADLRRRCPRRGRRPALEGASATRTPRSPAWANRVPELCHNEVAGWGQHGDVTRQVLTLVELRHDHEHPQIGRRFELVNHLVEEVVAGPYRVDAERRRRAGPAPRPGARSATSCRSTWPSRPGSIPGPIPALDYIKQGLSVVTLSQRTSRPARVRGLTHGGRMEGDRMWQRPESRASGNVVKAVVGRGGARSSRSWCRSDRSGPAAAQASPGGGGEYTPVMPVPGRRHPWAGRRRRSSSTSRSRARWPAWPARASPATNVLAVAMNVTVVSPTGAGLPHGLADRRAACRTRPRTTSGRARSLPNFVVSGVGPGGQVNFMLSARRRRRTSLVDVVGWYGTSAATRGARLVPLAPVRLLDTRVGTGTGAGRQGRPEAVDLVPGPGRRWRAEQQRRHRGRSSTSPARTRRRRRSSRPTPRAPVPDRLEPQPRGRADAAEPGDGEARR